MSKRKKYLFVFILGLCIWMITSFANQSFAQAQEHIFNQNQMYRLLFEGYDWNDSATRS